AWAVCKSVNMSITCRSSRGGLPDFWDISDSLPSQEANRQSQYKAIILIDALRKKEAKRESGVMPQI
ncbi:MAG: hypothetical protein IT273_00040, partial [Chitinophagales bacterium]|nr:hypothetical protein [Chitinophagales bacterium]